MSELNKFLTEFNNLPAMGNKERNRHKIIDGLHIRRQLKRTGHLHLDYSLRLKKYFQDRMKALVEREKALVEREKALTQREKVLDAQSEMSNIIKSAKKTTEEIFH